MASNVGWRYIFIISAIVSLIGFFMVRGTPESKAETKGAYKLDVLGIGSFLVAMVALQIVATQASKIGWTSPITLGLVAVTVVFGIIFFRAEIGNAHAFVNFRLFDNRIYTGATISNFLLNGIAGAIIVSMLLLQMGGAMTAQAAGMLTLGYAIAIVAFIRVGERLLQRHGSRKPMIWGCLITGLSILLLMPTNLMLEDYKFLVVISYTLLGLGLAFYATPSTDAALSNLPADQAGSGAGIYKMASSLGGSFGVALSAAIFTALKAEGAGAEWLEGIITFVGRQDNLNTREAALIALGFNLLMVATAILTIMLTVPAGKKTSE